MIRLHVHRRKKQKQKQKDLSVKENMKHILNLENTRTRRFNSILRTYYVQKFVAKTSYDFKFH